MWRLNIKQNSRRGPGKNRVNEQIEHPEVRLIAEDGKQVGVVSIQEALSAAEKAALDLVEMVPDAEPPVCRIMDYGKHLFEEKKKRTEVRKRQRQSTVKEIKIRPTTEDGDYQVKLKALRRFLADGDKAKITLRFRGRELAHQELGMRLLDRLKVDLSDCGQVEQEAKFEGRQMIMVIAPAKKK